jgi:23S rRNA pseudouridine2605 synthase
VPERVYPVGRLDYDVEGALLITNDGDLAHQLMHPKFGVRRTYLAKVSGHLDGPATERLLGKLLGGMRLEDGRAKALEADIHSRTPKNTWVRVVVSEGRQHLVKRLMETAGAPVVKLFRSDYGGIDVQGLRPGELRELTRAEMDLLRSHEAKRPKGASAEAGEPGRSGAKASAKRPGKPAPATAPRPFVGLPARRHGHGPPEPAGRRGQRRKR